MRQTLRLLCVFMMLAISGLNFAQNPETWYTENADHTIQLNVVLFMSSTCPHCHKANDFFTKLENEKQIKVERYYINKELSALTLFNHYLRADDSNNFSVPAIFFCDSHWVGYGDDAHSGKALLKAMALCRAEIIKQGKLGASTVQGLKKMAAASRLEAGINVEAQQSPFFMPLMAAIDALNPCSFILVFVLALFFIQAKGGEGRQLVAVIYLPLLATVHYLQQTQLFLFYRYYPFLLWPIRLIGLFLIVFAIGKIMQRKATLLTQSLIAALCALVLQIQQQGCVPNIALIYKEWLSAQQYLPWQSTVLLGGYNIIYMSCIAIFAWLIFRVQQMQRVHRFHSWILTFSFVFLLLLGLVFIIKVSWLTHNLFLSISVIVAALIAQILYIRQKRR